MRGQSEKTFHYAWVVVLAGFLTLFSCLGLARFAFGMLLPGMRGGLGLSYDQAGMISTGNFIGYLIAVALVPKIIRLAGPRKCITFGLALICSCLFGISQGQGVASVLFLYGLAGFGSGLANIPAMVLVSHWFRAELRGRAAGLMIAGNGSAIIFSGILIPELNQSVGVDGWRLGWLVLAGVVAASCLLVLFMVRNDPKDLDLAPCGPIGSPQAAAKVETDFGRGRLLFHLGLLYLIFGATYIVYGTFIVTSMVEDYGLSEVNAGVLWSWVGLLSIFSGVGFGSLSDRIGRRRGLALVFAIQAAAYLLVGSGVGYPALVGSVLLYGLAAFAIPTIMAATVGDYFGLGRAAWAFSLVTFFFAAGQVVGPAGAGFLAEVRGSFAASYLVCGSLAAFAAWFSLRLPGRLAAGKA